MALPLTPELEEFVQTQIDSGKYASTDEVIIAGLKLLEERERIYKGRFEELQKDILVGLAEAERGELIDGEQVFQDLQNKLTQRRIQLGK
ncbi:MAG: type II toxin-antitoxin system ParD family antitoxin [Cyanosarcina radialis HA8281-LM2]|jgi:antitoxin ParD1/3/4|nr:type II toxin-antitoxin system ParD family antitoxin [Cyanosarcina radialis HA8281-LM2]